MKEDMCTMHMNYIVTAACIGGLFLQISELDALVRSRIFKQTTRSGP